MHTATARCSRFVVPPKAVARRAFSGLTLNVADQMATGVCAAALRNGFAPVTATVVDSNGSIIVQKRMDGCCPAAIPAFSFAKAFTCISTGLSSRGFRDKYTAAGSTPAQHFQMLSMVNITDGKLAPFPGGVLLLQAPAESSAEAGAPAVILGAVGVSGASGDEDEYCALEGVKAGGLLCTPVPLQHECKTAKASTL
jgi:uncharacterized protein GlcG (DUF336 family)